jgi:site-specific DNA recombinase
MRIAAIYARVSSEQQREERTIASQTTALIEFAESHELEVPREWVFEDEGFSGATLERPGLERVRDLAAEGHIQVVLAYAPDRLSRKYAYQILLIEEFARHGVETLFVKAPQSASPEDQLLVQFQGMIAEYERAQILERSRRGKRHRARCGEISVLSGAPYGYRYIRKTDEAPASYMVIDAEARVVQRVYEMYTVEGLSMGEIARRLNAEGIPTRSKAPAGSARWCGPCCAIPPIAEPPDSARLTSPAEFASHGRCAGAAESYPATVSDTSVRTRSGSRSRCPRW